MVAINYAVRAEIVDINVDVPKAEDVFLVDTNVWYWMTYTRASQSTRPPAPYQTSIYPRYTNSALGAGARILHSGLSMAELIHLIEKSEREIYEAAHGQVGAKVYRHNFPHERTQVCAEIQAACAQVASLAEPLNITIDDQTVNAALGRLSTERMDGYDLFILESMKEHGVVQIITDDGDFAGVSGIRVFTANRKVIQAARAKGKLLAR